MKFKVEVDLISWKTFTYLDYEIISRLFSFLKTHQKADKQVRDFLLKIPCIYVCFLRELHSSNMIHLLYVVCSKNHSRMTGCKYHIIFKSQFKSSKNNFCKVYPKDAPIFCSTKSSCRGKMHSEKQNNLIFAIESVKFHCSTMLTWWLFLKCYMICFCFFLASWNRFPLKEITWFISLHSLPVWNLRDLLNIANEHGIHLSYAQELSTKVGCEITGNIFAFLLIWPIDVGF